MVAVFRGYEGAGGKYEDAWVVLVQAAGPRREEWKRLVKEHSAVRWYMPLWIWEEMVIARFGALVREDAWDADLYSELEDPTHIEVLHTLFRNYGAVPRTVLRHFAGRLDRGVPWAVGEEGCAEDTAPMELQSLITMYDDELYDGLLVCRGRAEKFESLVERETKRDGYQTIIVHVPAVLESAVWKHISRVSYPMLASDYIAALAGLR